MTDTNARTMPSGHRPEGDSALLSVEGLTVEFDTDDGIVHAVTDMSYEVRAGETLAIMGESGSGKSVSVQAIMGLIPKPPGRIAAGSVHYSGRSGEPQELLGMSLREQRKFRGDQISMIFQDPLTSLNPVFKVGWQIAEMIRLHEGVSRKEGRERAVTLMQRVGIPDARQRASQFPHQFSGGMRQRAMIAMALALEPRVLIADEPTTALDVTVQAQIMELLAEVQGRTGMAMILITHDLGVVASVADRVLVMYAGRCVETADAAAFYALPEHPYSQGLLASVPRVLTDVDRLIPVEGQPPSVVNLPSGCSFHPRCPHRNETTCFEERPDLIERGAHNRLCACHRIGEF